MSNNALEITLSAGELNGLRRLGDVSATLVAALRAYLCRQPRPLPITNLAGRAAPDAGVSYTWDVPNALSGEFTHDSDGLTHIRCAIREYLRFCGISITAPVSAPAPQEMELVNVVIRKDVVKHLRCLGGSLGSHVEKAIRKYYSRGKGMPIGSGEGGHGSYELSSVVFTELTWKVSQELLRLLPGDPKDRPAYIRAAIYHYLNRHKA